MGFSTRMILYSTILIMLVYVLIAYLYYLSICIFLNEFPDIRRYYRTLWWVVPFLPMFNVLTFFIRLTGIYNSMNTTSAWKTKTFTEEIQEYKEEVKKEAARITGLSKKLYYFLNEE
jgi:hypothetical protein